MPRYWIGVASREHVLGGVRGGFAQVCHGKPGPLKAMAPNDWIIYYSSKEKFNEPTVCQKFTALGKVEDREPYTFRMSDDFIPWRRDVEFLKIKEVSIIPLLDKLSFIVDKKRWGFPFRRGFLEITQKDFLFIASCMGVFVNE